jgi:hypothetical protein
VYLCSSLVTAYHFKRDSEIETQLDFHFSSTFQSQKIAVGARHVGPVGQQADDKLRHVYADAGLDPRCRASTPAEMQGRRQSKSEGLVQAFRKYSLQTHRSSNSKI